MHEVLKSRIQVISSSKRSGQCVLYVMSRDQRVRDNHALIAAQKHALAKNLPLAVVFCLYNRSGYRAREQYLFMLEGLKEIEASLASLSIPFMLVIGKPGERLKGLDYHLQPDAVYFDFSPLNGPRNVVKRFAEETEAAVYVVDTHNVVPTLIVSEKQEVGAYTIRPKIHKLFEKYLVEPEPLVEHTIPWPGTVQTLAVLQLKIDEVVQSTPENGTVLRWQSGEAAAHTHLDTFIQTKLETYATTRNDPSAGAQSDLSPYLHFGQISSLRVALRLREIALEHGSDLHFLSSPKMPKPENAESTVLHGIDSLIEEMIVRKELADNFCYWQPNYTSLEAAPTWAQKSLHAHLHDPREFLYMYDELRDGKTHDPAWNASQIELRSSGKIHGYMRMYWAKKVLEWTENPQQAIDFLVRLNDHYSIDGGDPNGYAGILWSVGGLHDRPWQERPIFGVVRYMNYGGLQRKFDVQSYIKQWQ